MDVGDEGEIMCYLWIYVSFKVWYLGGVMNIYCILDWYELEEYFS